MFFYRVDKYKIIIAWFFQKDCFILIFSTLSPEWKFTMKICRFLERREINIFPVLRVLKQNMEQGKKLFYYFLNPDRIGQIKRFIIDKFFEISSTPVSCIFPFPASVSVEGEPGTVVRFEYGQP